MTMLDSGTPLRPGVFERARQRVAHNPEFSLDTWENKVRFHQGFDALFAGEIQPDYVDMGPGSIKLIQPIETHGLPLIVINTINEEGIIARAILNRHTHHALATRTLPSQSVVGESHYFSGFDKRTLEIPEYSHEPLSAGHLSTMVEIVETATVLLHPVE